VGNDIGREFNDILQMKIARSLSMGAVNNRLNKEALCAPITPTRVFSDGVQVVQ
jgi:hypothetical protein